MFMNKKNKLTAAHIWLMLILSDLFWDIWKYYLDRYLTKVCLKSQQPSSFKTVRSGEMCLYSIISFVCMYQYGPYTVSESIYPYTFLKKKHLCMDCDIFAVNIDDDGQAPPLSGSHWC